MEPERNATWNAPRQGLEVNGQKTRLSPANGRVARHILLGIPSVEVAAGGGATYADGVGGTGYADMGRTGTSALAHYLHPANAPAFKAFAKLNAECIGNHPDTFIDTHGCPLLGMVWTALGAATDPSSFRKLMDHNRCAFSLSHCPDGTFYYQPNRDNNPQDYAAAPRLAATAATALILTTKQKQLQMTGAKPVVCTAGDKRP